MNIDEAKQIFEELRKEWLLSIDNALTEQDTRFQIIDLMLTKVLGWTRPEIKTEPYTEKGYIDYLLHAEGRARMVVEAKKVSKLLIDTRNPKMNYYQLNGPALKSAQEGFKQAIAYCVSASVSFAALTTGFEWIGFVAVKTDGKPLSERKCIVFPSLESISENFAKFYDLFSKDGILSNLHIVQLNEAEGLNVCCAERLYQVVEKNQIKLLIKSRLASDMDQIFKEFFNSMSGKDDPEMLAKCFVESKESKETDSSLQKITKNLINQIEVFSSDKGKELQEEIRYAVETRRGEFVLIIGNKGAGKSTFIDRFFSLILDPNLQKKCLVIKIDLRDSTGDLNNIINWLLEILKDELESKMFKGKITYDQLKGVFFKEYERWKYGEYKPLYEKDKEEFKIRFGGYISKYEIEHPEKYITYLLRNAIKSRGLMPCLVFDNTDHFSQPFQEKVFQFAQSIYRTVFSFIICPITDRTIWQLSKEGPFQSYKTKSFYLPVPLTKEILRKRVLFINQKLEEEKQKKGEYFLKKGIRLTISDIKAFIACIENILVDTDYVSRMVGWLSNHDIRRGLEISQRIVTSPFIELDDLVKTYLSNQNLFIQPYQIKKAIILGEYNHFNSSNSAFILNAFTVDPEKITSPLIKLSILRLLIDKDNQCKDLEDAYLSVENILSYFNPTGISTPTIIKDHIRELLLFRLVQPYDPTNEEVYEDQRIRITHSGKIHCELSLKEETYVSHMALVTPIRNYDIVSDIREIRKSKLDKQEWLNIISTFIKYCLEQDKIFISLPKTSIYNSQSQLRHELKMKWVVSFENENY